MKLKSIFFLAAVLITCCSFAQDATVLTLEECLQMAASDNIKVRNSHLDYLSAKMQKREIKANYFPTVNVQATGYKALKPMVRISIDDVLTGNSDAVNNLKYYLETSAGLNGINTTFSTLSDAYGAAVVLTQPVYAGGRIVNGNRLASLGVEAASLQESIARRDIVSSVEAKYWTAVSLEEKLKVVEDALALADNLSNDVRSAFNAGLVTDSELDEVEMGRQDLRSKRIRLKGSIMLARMDLCNSLGMNSSTATSLVLQDRLGESLPPENYYRDPAAMVAELDESKLLELSVRQKDLEKKMALGEALPEVGVGATYSYGRLIGTPQTNGAVYATVKVPITDWSKADSKMKNIGYQMEKAKNDQEYLGSMLELQIRQLWVELESTWEELQLKEERVEYRKTLAARAKADADAGLATKSQLMKKEVELSEALCDRIDAQIAYRNAVNAFLAKCPEQGSNLHNLSGH